MHASVCRQGAEKCSLESQKCFSPTFYSTFSLVLSPTTSSTSGSEGRSSGSLGRKTWVPPLACCLRQPTQLATCRGRPCSTVQRRAFSRFVNFALGRGALCMQAKRAPPESGRLRTSGKRAHKDPMTQNNISGFSACCSKGKATCKSGISRKAGWDSLSGALSPPAPLCGSRKRAPLPQQSNASPGRDCSEE